MGEDAQGGSRPHVETGDGATGADSADWIERQGVLRIVCGHEEASALLADPRMHADLASIFRMAGIDHGPSWDAVESSLLSLNGPEHRRYRACVVEEFTPRAVERGREMVRQLADEHVAALDSGSMDFVDAFATPYVSTATCRYTGIPTADYASIADAVAQVGLASQNLPRRGHLFDEGITALVTYAARVLDADDAPATGSVVERLKASVADGALPARVAEVLIATILSAGTEPTINQLGLTVEVLAAHPQIWEDLASGSMAPARVVEEMLRFCPTNRVVNRTVTESMSYGGEEFAEGEAIFISLERSNRDARRFDHPADFDPTRPPAPHLAFGLGAHYCLGAALARMELQEGLRALAARFRAPRVLQAVRSEGAGLLGHTELVVELEPRAVRAD